MTSKRRNKTKEKFPTLGIKEFQPGPESAATLQYHEIHGEKNIEKPHKHDFFVFLLFEEGSGTHTIDFIDYKITGHQVHLLFPNQVHRWEFGKNTKACQLMISKNIFEAFTTSLESSFVLYQAHPVVNLAPPVFQKLLYEFQAIRTEIDANPVQWNIVNLRSKLIAQIISHEAEAEFKDMTIYRAKPLLLKYHSLIEHYFKEQKSVAFYARRLHISANYLNILCKKNLHVSATFLIQNRLILEAKRLIQGSEMSLKEISFELGFNEPAYFSGFFKKQTGLSPRQFREQL